MSDFDLMIAPHNTTFWGGPEYLKQKVNFMEGLEEKSGDRHSQ